MAVVDGIEGAAEDADRSHAVSGPSRLRAGAAARSRDPSASSTARPGIRPSAPRRRARPRRAGPSAAAPGTSRAPVFTSGWRRCQTPLRSSAPSRLSPWRTAYSSRASRLMSRFSTQLICTGCTPSARRPERILNVRARLAGEHGVGEREHVEAAVVRDELEHLGLVDLAARGRQREPLDLLVGREQVAFDALGERLRGGLRELQACRPAARCWIQRGSSPRSIGQISTTTPCCSIALTHADRRGLAELLADRDDHERIGIVALAKRRDRLRAFVARLRRREPDLDDLARREQRQVVGAGEQIDPLEAAVGGVQLAAREARAHRRRAQLLERLVDEQRLVAGDEIDLGQATVEVTLELTKRDFQNGLRPMTLRVAGAAWLGPRAARECRRARDR